MTKLQAICWFADFVAEEHVIITRDEEWSCSMIDWHPLIRIPYNLTKNDEEDKMFRADFIRRCPLGRGFSNVTLSILHEIGHHFNREEFIFADKVEGDTMEEHLTLPCEIVATDWAIKWLQDPIHRKIAKKFERDFRGHA